jgi:dCTP deaminase
VILADFEIRRLALDDGMIAPFYDPARDGALPPGRISHGLSSFGYDARLAGEFKVVNQRSAAGEMDPKAIDEHTFNRGVVSGAKDGRLVIPPNSFALGRTVERFRIPRDVVAICLGKSTYARCGIIVNVTPLEPEWHGVVTIEISNTAPLPAVVYVGEGICQFIFLRGQPCKRSYADKRGKYQGQTGVTLPIVK